MLRPERGQRVLVLDSNVVMVLAGHKRTQDPERASAGERWRDGDLVFTTPTSG